MTRRAAPAASTMALVLLASAWFATPTPAALIPTRQVTLFAIRATPDQARIDPKLKPIAGQLRRVLPGHGFELIAVRSRTMRPNDALICPIRADLGARADLIQTLGPDGKVQFRFTLITPDGLPLISTVVATPPNQLFFCDKRLDDGTRVLIGIGAR